MDGFLLPSHPISLPSPALCRFIRRERGLGEEVTLEEEEEEEEEAEEETLASGPS